MKEKPSYKNRLLVGECKMGKQDEKEKRCITKRCKLERETGRQRDGVLYGDRH